MSSEPAAGGTYLRRYLRIAPLALALWRAAEARAIAGVDLPRPVLDLGCGFAEFGGVFFDEPADAGLDVNGGDLRLARDSGVYRHLVRADGRSLPFREATFASVLSVSVLEHIDGAERVLPEVWRVLRPGGVFVFTTPSPEMGDMLAYPRLLSRVGLRSVGRWYGRRVDRFFHHVSLKPADEWRRLLTEAGFRVREARATIPLRLTAAFDLALAGALPSQVGRALGRRRWVLRPPGAVALMARLLGGLVDEESDEGCNLFFVADKP